jgi:hypothetical protein
MGIHELGDVHTLITFITFNSDLPYVLIRVNT